MSAAQEVGGAGRERRTDYVVLAVLQLGPATGYGVRNRIASTVGNFWQESYGQLYPALRRLTARGLLRARAVSVGRRAAEEFAITAQGTRVLRDWVRRPPRVEPERNELLLKLFLCELDPCSALLHVQGARATAEAERARLEQMLGDLSKSLAGAPSLPAWCATVDYGILVQKAIIEWCSRTIKRLEGSSTSRARSVQRKAARQSKPVNPRMSRARSG